MNRARYSVTVAVSSTKPVLDALASVARVHVTQVRQDTIKLDKRGTR